MELMPILRNAKSRLSRVVRLIISAIFLAGVSIGRAILRLRGKASPATCIILYYHSVPPEERAAFARQLDTVARLTEPLSLENPSGVRPGGRYCAITFDDGFEDVIENAIPELVKRKIPAVFFITTGYVGQLASWWPQAAPQRNRRIATLEQLRELPPEWITLGAHTRTHPRLTGLDEATAKLEIVEPRQTLEAALGRRIELFSFPYGDFNQELVQCCKQAGYKRVFTTQHKNAFQTPEEFAVGRVTVEPTDWKLEFRLKLMGGYLWRPWASAAKRRLLAFPIASRLASARSASV